MCCVQPFDLRFESLCLTVIFDMNRFSLSCFKRVDHTVDLMIAYRTTPPRRRPVRMHRIEVPWRLNPFIVHTAWAGGASYGLLYTLRFVHPTAGAVEVSIRILWLVYWPAPPIGLMRGGVGVGLGPLGRGRRGSVVCTEGGHLAFFEGQDEDGFAVCQGAELWVGMSKLWGRGWGCGWGYT